MNRKDKEKRERKKQDMGAWAKEPDKGFVSHSIRLPDGFEAYKLEVGTHIVDFMPSISGSRNPGADEDYEVCKCEYWVHRIPSSNGFGTPYCCASECFNKPCAVCRLLMKRDLDEGLRKSMRVNHRILFTVNDKPGDTKNKLKIFDIYHKNRGQGFGEMLKELVLQDPQYEKFWELNSGLSVRLTVKEFAMPGGNKHNAVTRIDFVRRDYDYPESMLDKAPCLDDCLVDTPYKELEELLAPGESESKEPDEVVDEDAEPVTRRRVVEEEETEEPEEEETPAPRKRKPAPVEEEEAEIEEEPEPVKKGTKTAKSLGLKLHDFVMYIDPESEESVECEILKISEDGTKLLLENDDGQSYPDVRVEKVKPCAKPGDEVEEEESEEEPAPRKGSKTQVKKPPVEIEEEETEDTDWGEDEPVKPKRRK